jgi:hypothetical protein
MVAMFAVNNVAELKPVTNSIPSPWVCLDIETGNASADAVQRALERWRPPSNVKDADKIEARRREAETKIREKSALLDAAPILCIAAKTETQAVLFDGMSQEPIAVPNWTALSCGSEREMLIAFRHWLDSISDEQTMLVGHGIKHFDLPKIRAAYVRHRLRLPSCLIGEQTVTDTMALFRRFSVEHGDDFFVSLDVVASSLGIERHKTAVTGADVPRLHEESRHAEIGLYCCLDVEVTARAFLLMSGEAADLN